MAEDTIETEAPLSIRDSLEAQMSDVAPVEAAAPAPQPRAEDGKFAPKTEGVHASSAQTIPPTTTAEPATEAQVEPIRPPASWSAQAKADFATLQPHIQAEVLKRENDVTKGFEERASQLKRYEPLDAVIAPHRERIALTGIDEATYINQMFTADNMLRGPNRLQGLAQLAQHYGIDIRQLQGQPGQQQMQPQAQAPAQLPPELQSALSRIDAFEASQAQQQTSQTQAEIDAFSKDHLYFDNVKPAMAAMLKSGQAKDLAEAYDMACWARPDIRPLLLKEQTAKTAEQARAKATDARRASGSITGSPTAGSAPVKTGPAPTIRQSLEAQLGTA